MMTYQEVCEVLLNDVPNLKEYFSLELLMKTRIRPSVLKVYCQMLHESGKFHPDKLAEIKSVLSDHWGSKCIICDEPTACYNPDTLIGYCESHCPEHSYTYDPNRRGQFCDVCDKQQEIY